MKRIRELKIDGNFYMGSTIIITAILDYTIISGDAVTISIEDPSDTLKVDNVAMTSLTTNIYQYLYQTAMTDDDGEWTFTVKATSGGKIIYDSKTIEIMENPLET